jgi:hypothetical protein
MRHLLEASEHKVQINGLDFFLTLTQKKLATKGYIATFQLFKLIPQCNYFILCIPSILAGRLAADEELLGKFTKCDFRVDGLDEVEEITKFHSMNMFGAVTLISANDVGEIISTEKGDVEDILRFPSYDLIGPRAFFSKIKQALECSTK